MPDPEEAWPPVVRLPDKQAHEPPTDSWPPPARYPDWRVLFQDQSWTQPDGQVFALDEIADEALVLLQQALRGEARFLHDHAAAAEYRTTSQTMRLIYSHLGVAMIRDLRPSVWLESTPLMRAIDRVLRQRQAEADLIEDWEQCDVCPYEEHDEDQDDGEDLW